MSSTGRPFLSCTGASSIDFNVSRPSITRPMTGYWPFRLGCRAYVMKNCDPTLFGFPGVFARLTTPLRSCLSCSADGSLSIISPVQLRPPLPVPVGSPPWRINPGIERWKRVWQYDPAAARARKFLHDSGAWSQNNSILITPWFVWRDTDMIVYVGRNFFHLAL